jgi:sortase (surface protein transpeptidase)
VLLRRLRLAASLAGLLGLLLTTAAHAAEPPNQHDPCAKAGRDSCATTGVGAYRTYRYGVRWFGDYRKAVDGVDDPLFCVDLRFWYPSKAFAYERRSAAGLHNRDGKAVATSALHRMAYALWLDAGSKQDQTQQAATMLYVHGLMGDAAPGEVASNAIGSAVQARYATIARSAAKYAGPYKVEVKAGGALTVGTPATLTARVISASGAAVPNVSVALDGAGTDGLPKSVRTSATGAPAQATFTPTTADGAKVTAKAAVAATLPALYVPTKGEAVHSGQRLAGPATATVAATLDAPAKVAPQVHTQVSAQSGEVGSAITDSIGVTGLAGESVTVAAALYGPFPAPDKTACDGMPVWSGTITAAADGTYTTEPTKLTAPGYYTYVESIADSDRVTGTHTACGDAAETTVVRGAPAVATQVSAQASAPGAQITDSLTVTGLGVLSATVDVELWGPYATPAAIDCTGTPVWTGTVAAAGDGTYQSAAVTLPAAGYYTYRETLAESPAFPATATACGDAAETTLAKAAPVVTTAVADQVVRPGGTLADHVKVAGLGTTPATIDVRLYGPYATRAAMDCQGTPYWKGTLPVTGDGDFTSPKTTVKRAGFYVYVESIAGSDTVTATATDCADEAETSLSAPEILTGRGDVHAHPAASPSAAKTVQPTRVTIPRLGVDAAIVGADIDLSDGTLGIPQNIDRVGWWRDGAAPGDATGTILLAGHVDSAKRGAGAFYPLKSLRTGDTITVSSDDGKARRYRVTSLRRMPKAQLPTSVFTRTGEKRLVLVTCGGTFDPKTGHYPDNVVVTAKPA